MLSSTVSSSYVIRSARLKQPAKYKEDSSDESVQAEASDPESQDKFVRTSIAQEPVTSHDSDEYMGSSDKEDDGDDEADTIPKAAYSVKPRRRRPVIPSSTESSDKEEPAIKEEEDDEEDTIPVGVRSRGVKKRYIISSSSESKDSTDSDIPILRRQRKQQTDTQPPLKKMKAPVKTSESKSLGDSRFKRSESDDSDIGPLIPSIESMDTASLQPGTFRADPNAPADDYHLLFSLRDPNNIEHVIPELADPKNPRYPMPGIQVEGVYMATDTQYNYERLFNYLGRDAIKTIIKRKEDTLQSRQQSILDGTASSKRSFKDGPTVLFNKPQKALYATEDIPTDHRHIAEVFQQDWAYKGAFYIPGSNAEKQLSRKLGPTFDQYIREVKWFDPFEKKTKKAHICALNSGGYMHNANAALKEEVRLDSYLDYDSKRTNLMFEDYLIVYRLPDGRKLAFPHVEQPPMPGKRIRKGDELCVNYGPKTLAAIREEYTALSKRKDVVVKGEHSIDSEDEDEKLQKSKRNPFKQAASVACSTDNDESEWEEPTESDASSDDSSMYSSRGRSRSTSEFNRERELSIESRDLEKQYFEKTSKWLTATWENSEEREKARATVRLAIKYPDLRQIDLSFKLAKRDLSVAQTTISSWGIGHRGNLNNPELQKETEELLEAYPDLSQRWINTRQRHQANAAARVAIAHQRWPAEKIIEALRQDGIHVTAQQLHDWGISEKNSPELKQEAKDLYDQILARTNKALTERWRNTAHRIKANAAAKIFLHRPHWSQDRIVKALKKQKIDLVKSTLATWGISSWESSEGLMEEARRLKAEMPFLTDKWVNSRRRAEANTAAQFFKTHPSWSAARIATALKRQYGIKVSPSALIQWGIHSEADIY